MEGYCVESKKVIPFLDFNTGENQHFKECEICSQLILQVAKDNEIIKKRIPIFDISLTTKSELEEKHDILYFHFIQNNRWSRFKWQMRKLISSMIKIKFLG